MHFFWFVFEVNNEAGWLFRNFENGREMSEPNRLVLGSPVRSGFLTPRDMDRDRDRSFEIYIGPKTEPNWYGPVFCGFLRLQDRSKPVMVQTGPKLVLDRSGLEKVYYIIHNKYKLNIQ